MPRTERWVVVQIGDYWTWGLLSPWGIVHAINGNLFDTEDEARLNMRASFDLLASTAVDRRA